MISNTDEIKLLYQLARICGSHGRVPLKVRRIVNLATRERLTLGLASCSTYAQALNTLLARAQPRCGDGSSQLTVWLRRLTPAVGVPFDKHGYRITRVGPPQEGRYHSYLIEAGPDAQLPLPKADQPPARTLFERLRAGR